MHKLPTRKPNRMQGYDYSQNGAYFVTICAKDRAKIFSEIPVGATALGRPFNRHSPTTMATIEDHHPSIRLTEIGKCIDETINIANNGDIHIDCYVIMPNHIHMIVVIRSSMGGGGDSTTGDSANPSAGDRGRSPLRSTGGGGDLVTGDSAHPSTGDRGRSPLRSTGGGGDSTTGDFANPSTGDRGRSPLQFVVRNIKSYVTKHIGFSPWQKSFHDHIIRNENEYIRIAEYIKNNPALWLEDCFYQ